MHQDIPKKRKRKLKFAKERENMHRDDKQQIVKQNEIDKHRDEIRRKKTLTDRKKFKATNNNEKQGNKYSE